MKTLLNKSGYTLNNDNESLVISYDEGGMVVWEVLSMSIGIFVLIFAVSSFSWKLILLALILIGVPFTSHRWRLPRRVTFNHLSGELLISYLRGKKSFLPSDRPELTVDYYAKSSFVSPFQDGYQDHYYTFQVAIGENRYNLFRIKTRNRIDEQIKKMVGEFAKLKVFSV